MAHHHHGRCRVPGLTNSVYSMCRSRTFVGLAYFVGVIGSSSVTSLFGMSRGGFYRVREAHPEEALQATGGSEVFTREAIVSETMMKTLLFRPVSGVRGEEGEGRAGVGLVLRLPSLDVGRATDLDEGLGGIVTEGNPSRPFSRPDPVPRRAWPRPGSGPRP
jgi:hypothetical protein